MQRFKYGQERLAQKIRVLHAGAQVLRFPAVVASADPAALIGAKLGLGLGRACVDGAGGGEGGAEPVRDEAVEAGEVRILADECLGRAFGLGAVDRRLFIAGQPWPRTRVNNFVSLFVRRTVAKSEALDTTAALGDLVA